MISSIDELNVGNFFKLFVKAFAIKANGVIFIFSPDNESVKFNLKFSSSVISISSWWVTCGIVFHEFERCGAAIYFTLGILITSISPK